MTIPEDVLYIYDTLRTNGYEAYVVGGGVRDALLGRTPKDWDVATDAPPDDVQRLFPKTVATGLEFGTITVLVGAGRTAVEEAERSNEAGATEPPAHHAIEVTTFRGESGYVDGRHPDFVQFIGRIEDDLVRRDFTVNAIAYDPGTNRIVDPHGGRSDLHRRLIRAVGNPDERFQEDGLRVLRAIRLATELNFHIETATGAALRRHGSRLQKISRERIGQEWRRMLQSRGAGRGLKMLNEFALLRFVLPMNSTDRSTAEAVARTAAALQRGQHAGFVEKTAIVLHGLGRLSRADGAEHWLKQLVYPKQVARAALHIKGFLGTFDPGAMTDDIRLRRFLRELGRPYIDLFSNAWSGWQLDDDPSRIRERIARIVAAGDPLATNELAIDGHDVQKLLAIPSGPPVRDVLEQLLEHVLQHPEDNTRARLKSLLKSLLEARGRRAGQ